MTPHFISLLFPVFNYYLFITYDTLIIKSSERKQHTITKKKKGLYR